MCRTASICRVTSIKTSFTSWDDEQCVICCRQLLWNSFSEWFICASWNRTFESWNGELREVGLFWEIPLQEVGGGKKGVIMQIFFRVLQILSTGILFSRVSLSLVLCCILCLQARIFLCNKSQADSWIMRGKKEKNQVNLCRNNYWEC